METVFFPIQKAGSASDGTEQATQIPVDSKTENSDLKKNVDSIFSTAEISDQSSLETKILLDWHPAGATRQKLAGATRQKLVGATRQKLVEINVAEWWPGQDYRIPVRLAVPLEGKSQGFHITGTEELESLSKDFKPSAFEAKLLANGVSLVMTGIKALNTIPGKQALKQ